MAKVAPKDNADFVILMMNRDLDTIPDHEDKLDYLRFIGDHIDEVGEEILRRPKPKIGEDRPEISESDISLLELIYGLTHPEGLTPPQFLKANKCYKGAEARAWLYKNKYTHEYDHIHVFSNDLCLLMPEDSINGHYAWIAPDGVREEGEPGDVLKEMFLEYISSIDRYLENESHG